MKTTITLLSSMAIAASLAYAQDPPAGPPNGPGGPGKKHPPLEKIFGKLDTNQDKSLSLEEFKAGPRSKKDPAKAAEVFAKIDTDSSGGISLEEFKAHRPPHGKSEGKGKPGKDGANAPAEE